MKRGQSSKGQVYPEESQRKVLWTNPRKGILKNITGVENETILRKVYGMATSQ